MKVIQTVREEHEISQVRIAVDVRYEEEDMPNDYPGRKGELWRVTIDAKTGQIKDWPKGVEARDLYMKVCDCGTYEFIDANGDVVYEVRNNYVPSCIPGDYGDYIDFKINGDGLITNWDPDAVFDNSEE